MTTLEIYRSRNGWRWRARARNGKITANGGEPFASKSNAVRAARAVGRALVGAKLCAR